MVFGFKRKETPTVQFGIGVNLSRLKPISGLRHMDWGAPAPIILADEHKLSIAYYLDSNADWDGENAKLRDSSTDVEEVAVFYIRGLSSFSQRSTLQPDHLCPFFNYLTDDYPSHGVWEIQGPLSKDCLGNQTAYPNDKRLIFSFHDTAIDCFCSEYEFETLVSSGVTVLEKMENFIFPS